jgi:hypothetical protein
VFSWCVADRAYYNRKADYCQAFAFPCTAYWRAKKTSQKGCLGLTKIENGFIIRYA